MGIGGVDLDIGAAGAAVGADAGTVVGAGADMGVTDVAEGDLGAEEQPHTSALASANTSKLRILVTSGQTPGALDWFQPTLPTMPRGRDARRQAPNPGRGAAARGHPRCARAGGVRARATRAVRAGGARRAGVRQ